MIRFIAIGAVAGMRSFTPLAAVAGLARLGALPRPPELVARTGQGLPAVGIAAAAIGELLGDKLPFAPNRIVLPGLVARTATGALAASALAERDERARAAILGALAAAAASYVTFRLRARAMRRFGQVPSGVAEDVVALGIAALVARQTPRTRACEDYPIPKPGRDG